MLFLTRTKIHTEIRACEEDLERNNSARDDFIIVTNLYYCYKTTSFIRATN